MNGPKAIWYSAALVLLFFKMTNLSYALIPKIEKVQCLEYDKPFADFKKCLLKALSRDKSSLSVHVRLHQVPVANVSINAELLRKGYTQKYRSYMYNETNDFCKFLKFPNRSVFWKIVYLMIKPYSNINHTCPFDHDILVENLILDGSMFKMIPFPAGNYMVRLNVAAYNHFRAEIRIFVSIKE